ncbi:trp operon repressor [Vibrio agarivorans]|uniref:Trp operon repressor homolog n=1 Tax=Vibrio agarivorans TaxID=153622 RepID=A0ABT7Y1P4_9VIBR|nr:trp operon repressor [Vibrio agarivorans]MDN2481958.1 trp operon repressor [Vibrio agarivorans]
MSSKPDYSQWDEIIALIKESVDQEQHELLLTLLMTPDEREAMLTRVNIVSELLKGDLSQRQISQMLGVGVATITRGSTELKSKTEEQKAIIEQLVLK